MSDTPAATCVLEPCGAASGIQADGIRFTPERADSSLVVEGKRIAVEVVHESFDGLAVLVQREFHGEANDPIELVYRGLPLRGVIRSVTRQGRGSRVSIQWSQCRRTATEGRRRCRTDSDYYLLAGLPVACRVVDQAGNKLIAALPDGSQVELEPENVRTLNRFQRLAGLEGADEELRLLVAVYQLGPVQTADDALRDVLNLEFAPSWERQLKSSLRRQRAPGPILAPIPKRLLTRLLSVRGTDSLWVWDDLRTYSKSL